MTDPSKSVDNVRSLTREDVPMCESFCSLCYAKAGTDLFDLVHKVRELGAVGRKTMESLGVPLEQQRYAENNFVCTVLC